MARDNNCDMCGYYCYDELTDTYYCDVNLDEDDMARFIHGANGSCPYFKADDEYKTVRKQN